MQASEYNIRDFFAWHERTSDFRSVEKRKALVFTPKAIALYGAGWLVVILGIIAAFLALSILNTPWNYVLGILMLLELPLLAMVGVLAALLLLRMVQYPVEWFLVARAAQTIARHKGIKIAIAGSYGKTSTREILRTVLSQGKKVAAPGGSHNTPLGIASFVRGLKGDEEVLIFELGEYYRRDIERLARMIHPDWGIITGINEAHLEKFKTLEETARTIFELKDFVRPTHLYVNGENALAREYAGDGNVLYSNAGAGRWSIRNAATSLSGTTFDLTDGSETIHVQSKLLGLHMVPTLAMAADIAAQLGLANQQIERGLSHTKPFEHRLELKQWADSVTFLDDSYNGNPDGARAVIAFLATLSGRRFYVTPGLVEAGEQVQKVHEDIGGELARAGVEKIVLIKTSVTPHIEHGLKKAGFQGEILWYDDMPSALNALKSLTIPGDIILVQNDWPDQYA